MHDGKLECSSRGSVHTTGCSMHGGKLHGSFRGARAYLRSRCAMAGRLRVQAASAHMRGFALNMSSCRPDGTY